LARQFVSCGGARYGIGKTHRLHHTQYLVTKNGYKYKPVYARASDIQEKTGFDALHYELLNALGREETQKTAPAIS